MTRSRLSRRELLAGLGVASASTLLWACSGAQQTAKPARTAASTSGEVRTWLREAVARLAAAYPVVHALAVTRRRTTAAIDVLGAGIGRARRDGVVLSVRDREGIWREQVTSDLTQVGIAAAIRALVGPSSNKLALHLGSPPPAPDEPPRFADAELRDRVEEMTRLDKLDSRVVYAAAMIDIDDSVVWSITPASDREQRLVRVRKHVLRAAWNGTRPVVSEAGRAWIGGLDDQELDAELVGKTTQHALELMTPGSFEEQERTLLLDPSVTASLIDAGTRSLLTAAASRRPEVHRAFGIGATVASPLVTLVDDPTVRGAYGGFEFDDEGEAAVPITLIAAGQLSAVLSDRASGGRGRGRRPGHVGTIESWPSHLRVSPGTLGHAALQEDGFLLEGGGNANVDPATARVVISAARARELHHGQQTGRVYGDVELVGELPVLLGTVSGVSADTTALAYRDERDGEPRWRSIDAPWLRMKGVVRVRRRFG